MIAGAQNQADRQFRPPITQLSPVYPWLSPLTYNELAAEHSDPLARVAYRSYNQLINAADLPDPELRECLQIPPCLR
jgi:hypothetical protein